MSYMIPVVFILSLLYNLISLLAVQVANLGFFQGSNVSIVRVE
jgi:hypothetical protein